MTIVKILSFAAACRIFSEGQCQFMEKPPRGGVFGLEARMNQRIINLYDRFTHGFISRRDFLDQLAGLTGSAAAAAALLPLLANDYAKAAIVDANDARLISEQIGYDSPAGKIAAYLTRDKAKTKRPAVIVIHENRGLNPHIEDVARRMALEGFLMLAPDLLSV